MLKMGVSHLCGFYNVTFPYIFRSVCAEKRVLETIHSLELTGHVWVSWRHCFLVEGHVSYLLHDFVIKKTCFLE